MELWLCHLHICLIFGYACFILWRLVLGFVPQAFCDELETMIQDQLKKGKTPTSLLALQQIADFMTTSMPSMYPAAPQGGMAALNMSKQINRMSSGQEVDLSSVSAATMSNIPYANRNFSIWVVKLTFFLICLRCSDDVSYRLWEFSTFFVCLFRRFGYGDSSKRSPWLGLYFLRQGRENASLQAGCLLPPGWFVQLVRTDLQPPHSKTKTKLIFRR